MQGIVNTTYLYHTHFQVTPEKCYPKPCSLGPFYQPSLPDDKDLYAIGAYYKTIEAFTDININEKISPSQIQMAAHRYCQKVYILYNFTELFRGRTLEIFKDSNDWIMISMIGL